jgi:formylglycine-generating enzyme required for sulfatase activity
MKRVLLASVIGAALTMVGAQAAPPVVSNVRATQIAGTKNVEILYDVSDADGDLLTIAIQVSGDAGQTYTIPATALSGNIGAGVTSGVNRRIVWNAGADWNGQFVSNAKVRVTANNGTSPPPPPGMVYVPAGTFQMGDNFNEAGSDALPVHNVDVSGFFMDQFEVKREVWDAVTTWSAANGYSIGLNAAAAGSGYPIHTVPWFSAVLWCNARSEKEGLAPVYYSDDAQTQVCRSGNPTLTNARVKWNASGYRLPTEAEWEKAARGGALGLRYPWGDTVNGSHANFSGSGDPYESQTESISPVGYYNGMQVPAGVNMANGYGLYDMAGNVTEWCWDWYSSTYYGAGPMIDPMGPATGTGRVMRGGSYHSPSTGMRTSVRASFDPSQSTYWLDASFNRHYQSGFRCVRRP